MQTDKLTRIFRALSDETRLKLIKLLSRGEKCVCELFEALDAHHPKVSRHLSYLKKTGLVMSRKQGLWQYYSLNARTLKKTGLDKPLNIGKIPPLKSRKGCSRSEKCLKK